VKPWKFKPLICDSRQWRGVAQGLGPFYSAPPPDNLAFTVRFTFLPQRSFLSTIISSGVARVFLLGKN
jgi:hypothetical protein